MLQGVFLGVLFLAKLAMLRKKLSEVAIVDVVSRKWDFENASTFLSPSFLPSFLLWTIASPPTRQNWKTKTPW
jgi:hypothetical protein